MTLCALHLIAHTGNYMPLHCFTHICTTNKIATTEQSEKTETKKSS